MWSYAIHLKDFLAISENFESFHVELASQPKLSYQGGGELNMAKKWKILKMAWKWSWLNFTMLSPPQ